MLKYRRKEGQSLQTKQLMFAAIFNTKRGVRAMGVGTAHAWRLGDTKPRSPFKLAPQSPSDFSLSEDKLWGLPVGRGRTPAQSKRHTNKQTSYQKKLKKIKAANFDNIY